LYGSNPQGDQSYFDLAGNPRCAARFMWLAGHALRQRSAHSPGQ